jgi:hypothetical protein
MALAFADDRSYLLMYILVHELQHPDEHTYMACEKRPNKRWT